MRLSRPWHTPPTIAQVRCTLLPPRVPRLSLMLSSLHKEGQVCSLRLALDP